MSNILLDPQLDTLTRALRYSGEVWYDRLRAAQLPLARQVAALALPSGPASWMAQAGAWINGDATDSALHVWSFALADLRVQGQEGEGLHPIYGIPIFNDSTVDATDASYVPFIPPAGETSGYLDYPDAVRSDQTVWFLPKPESYFPTLLIAESGILVEGVGFTVSANWLMFYENPLDLWPERVIVGRCRRHIASWKSTALSVNNLLVAGKHVALYRRQTQNLKQLELALCEVAGLPILDAEGIVIRMEGNPYSTQHWLEDGRTFTLPGKSPYSVGSRVDALDGHLLKIRHASINGPDWWRGRPWISQGISITDFRPEFSGFFIRDEMVEAIAYRDNAGVLRAKLLFGQSEEAEDIFWAWQARQENTLPVNISTLAEILGFTTEDEHARVNALELFAGIYGAWLGVIETSLDVSNPVAYAAVRDFLARERPSGSVYVLRSSELNNWDTDPNYTYLHLDTGEQVMADDLPVVMEEA